MVKPICNLNKKVQGPSWTASLDKIFVDLVVRHIQQGNRQNNVFDKKTCNYIRDNKQTDLNFNNNRVRKHLDVLRTRFYNLKSAHDENDLAIDYSCSIGFDQWEELGHRAEIIEVKDCPIYEQVRTIFTELDADGKYAQSSHHEQLNKPAGANRFVANSCPDGGTLSVGNPLTKTKHGNLLYSGKMMKAVLKREETKIRCTSFHWSKQHKTKNLYDHGRSLVRHVRSFQSENS